MESGDHIKAEREFSDGLNVTGFPDVVYTSLWTKLCSARLHLKLGGPAIEACSKASERDPDNEGAWISKVQKRLMRGVCTRRNLTLAPESTFRGFF